MNLFFDPAAALAMYLCNIAAEALDGQAFPRNMLNYVELPFSVAPLFSFSIVEVLGWKYFFLQQIRQKIEYS